MTDDYMRVRDAQGLARPSTALGERPKKYCTINENLLK